MNIICQLCKKVIETPDYGDGVLDMSDVYEYRGFTFHETCFDEGSRAVERKRAEVITETKASLESQANGEWVNGGYKNMGLCCINMDYGTPDENIRMIYKVVGSL